MIEYPVIGQRVQLNNEGLNTINGVRTVKEFYDSQDMVITEVKTIPCDDAVLFQISVDKPSINKFVITNYDVDAL